MEILSMEKSSLVASAIKKNFSLNGLTIEVLKNVDLHVGSSELLAIVGASGSGKSTLLGILSGLDSPTSGKVAIDDTDIYSLTQEERTKFRANKMGMVFQNFHLMNHLTALENIRLPLEILGIDFNQNEPAQLLESLGLSHRLDHFPSQMSGGECQRIAIARALIAKPKIVFADEPSGNLDQATSKKVMDLFFKQIRDREVACVLVTHNLDLAKQCDRILQMRDGVLCNS
jgi:putative ABC transport system ATP-binding protein